MSAGKSQINQYHIIGAGPVGLAAALLLAKSGIQSIVYEGRPEIRHVLQESYPIGVNPRGLHTLGEISDHLKDACITTGMVVDSWEIFGGSRKVADLKSGHVYGTSRGKVNILLAEEAAKSGLIEVKFNHRLREIRFLQKQLVFDEYLSDGSKNEVIIDTSTDDSRVIAADGCNSKARFSLQQQDPHFTATVVPWKNEFRVLFATPGKLTPNLNTSTHYIFSGCYCATVNNLDQTQWTLSLGARDDCSLEDRKILLSSEATPTNITALKSYIERNAPLAAQLFTDTQELTQYFSRRSYRGAVVSCNKSNFDEWLVLIGDAAHSLLPPTGEGINSGLEDALELVKCIKNHPNVAFSTYSNKRQKDISALSAYASYINEGWDLKVPGEAGARLTFMILESLLKSSGLFSSDINTELFGPKSVQRIPYSTIVGSWLSRKRYLLPFARLFIYPFAWLFVIVSLPITFVRFVSRWLRSNNDGDDVNHLLPKTLKPPIAY